MVVFSIIIFSIPTDWGEKHPYQSLDASERSNDMPELAAGYPDACGVSALAQKDLKPWLI
jgi:hypothetical protein